jgi:hypothetical protein
MIVSDIGEFGTTRQEVRDEFDKRLKDITQQQKIKQGKKVEPEPFVMSAEMAQQLGLKIPPKEDQ